MNNHQQTIVVTGVSSGIGYEIARDLVAKGFNVFGSVRKQGDGQVLQQALGENFIPLYFDVTEPEAISAAVKQVEAFVGNKGIAGLVNNAGVSITGPLMHTPLAEVRHLFEVNVLGVIAVTQAFLPLLGATESATHPPGRIVNIGSVSGAIVAPFLGAYAATKHALEAVSQSFRRELIMYGIDVSIIEPSFIKTDMFDKNKQQVADNRFLDTGYANFWQLFLKSFAESEKKAQSAEVVSAAVYKALTKDQPKSRYPLDPIWWISRLLSDRKFDNLIFNAMGLKEMLKRRGNKI